MRVKIIVFSIVVVGASWIMASIFPFGSVMNFNPAYMTFNSKWSVSYESYFENQKMDFMIFQPFENGFAGKIGVYSNGNGSGIAYSVATKKDDLSIGSDFLLSNDGTSVHFDMGLGMLQRVWKNLFLDLMIPKAVSYVYEVGIAVHPNFNATLNWEAENWNTALFGGIDYPWVNGGIWSSVSLFGFQAFGYFEMGYDSALSGQVQEQRIGFTLQYTISNVKMAYIYDKENVSTHAHQENQGLRISVEW